MPGGSTTPDEQCDSHHAEHDPPGRQAEDGSTPPSATRDVRSVHRVHAGQKPPHRGGLDRSVLRLRREAAGAHPTAPRELWAEGETAAGRPQNLADHTRGNDWGIALDGEC